MCMIYGEKKEEKTKDDISTSLHNAWYINYYKRVKKLPNLSEEIKKLFKKKKKVNPKSRMGKEDIEAHYKKKKEVR